MPDSRKLPHLSHGPAVKLALIYASVFGLLCVSIFWLANVALTKTIEKKHLKAVENKAYEYRAWYQQGAIEQLESRMSEQSSQAGDLLFVRVLKGTTTLYSNFTTDKQDSIPYTDLENLALETAGNGVIMGGEKWTVASINLADGAVLQAGKNSQALKKTLSEFRETFLILFIPGGLLAILCSIFLAYHFLSPIRRLTSTMQGILSSGDLSQRAIPIKQANSLNSIVDLFNQLLGKNQHLIDAMQDSLDNIAHDLRSPFSRIKIISDRALSTSGNHDDAYLYKNALEQSAEELQYIEHLLKVLLDVAEAESGALILNKEPITVKDLLGKVKELYELVAEERSISLKIDCPHPLLLNGDRIRLMQSLANLVDNAIKYSPDGGAIEISASAANDQVHVQVSDQGIGISNEDLPLIWNRLYRADLSRSQRGMGLGLSFVKALIESHGGKVSVKSELGAGSTFQLSLPV